MVVRDILELPNGRRKIITEEGQTFCLYKGELSRLKLKVNEEINPDEYNKIMTEILPKRAKLRGLNLLTKRPYTEYQLRQKYIDGGYPESVIEEAINYIKEMHCLDDHLYCVTYISYRSNSKSKRQIFNDLKQKGVAQDIIESAYMEVFQNGDLTAETEVIEKLLRKRHYDAREATYEEKLKTMNYLYNKGFSMDAIRACVD